MSRRYQHHYDREEARALLPQVRLWLRELNEQRLLLDHLQERLAPLLRDHADLGGPETNGWVRSLVRVQRVLAEFQRREIQIKDIERGLVDFPSILAGREVFLCWQEGEEDIEYWHDLDSGFAGREPI